MNLELIKKILTNPKMQVSSKRVRELVAEYEKQESALAHVRGAAKWLLDCPDAMKAEATAELRKAVEENEPGDRDQQIQALYFLIVRLENDPSLTSDQLYDEGFRKLGKTYE